MAGNGPPLSDAATGTLLASIYQSLAPALAVQIWFAVLNSEAAPVPSPTIWGNLVQFNCWSVCKEELGTKWNCFPGWAFKVQILGSENSLWDYGKLLLKYSSEAIEKFSYLFSMGSPQILFPVRSWVCTWWVPSKLGCLHWWCSSAVGPPTLQPWPPRDSTRNEGKPQPVLEDLREASITCHSLRETWACHHCTSQ